MINNFHSLASELAFDANLQFLPDGGPKDQNFGIMKC